MQEMVIDFDPSGGVAALHREGVLALGFLGNQDITRVTDIRFDVATQTWGLWPATSRDVFIEPPCEAAKGFASYEEARDVEVAWLERCRLFGREALSESGLLILDTLRNPRA